MWTRNYKNLITTVVYYLNKGVNGASGNPFGGDYSFNYKDPTGTAREIVTYNDYGSYGNYTGKCALVRGNYNTTLYTLTDQTARPGFDYICPIYVGFGSSSSEETELDYALGQQISTFQQNSATATPALNADGTFTIDYQAIITATADITIREIGLFIPMYYYGANSNAANYMTYMLINRIVLDSPISVASGEVANVTFTVTTPKITFN